MAIQTNNITLDGHTYTLDERDRVAAELVNENANTFTKENIFQSTVYGNRTKVENVTADDTLTAAESGKTFVFTDAAAVLTLPDSGAGDIIGVNYTFISGFQATGQEVLCTDTTNEIIVGNLIAADTDGDAAAPVWNAQVSDGFSSIEFTSVADGEIHGYFTLLCFAADRWLVRGVIMQSGGSEATPFAAS